MKKSFKYLVFSFIMFISIGGVKAETSIFEKGMINQTLMIWGISIVLIIIVVICLKIIKKQGNKLYLNRDISNGIDSVNRYYSGRYVLDFSDIDKKQLKQAEVFRDLPENKNIFRFYWIAKNFDIIGNSTTLIGAMFLKWIDEGKLKISSKEVGLRKVPVFIFKKDVSFNDEIEEKLYNLFEKIDPDLQITDDQMKEWFEENEVLISVWFWEAINRGNDIMLYDRKITEIEKFNDSKTIRCDVDESLLDEALKVKGLQLFFKNFDSMKDKDMIDVKMWHEYLIYAQIFGLADKLSEEFSKIYPNEVTQNVCTAVRVVNRISSNYTYNNYTHDNVYRNPIQSYNYKSGGGGFSSGGGGGGSFGGGGGGGFR